MGLIKVWPALLLGLSSLGATASAAAVTLSADYLPIRPHVGQVFTIKLSVNRPSSCAIYLQRIDDRSRLHFVASTSMAKHVVTRLTLRTRLRFRDRGTFTANCVVNTPQGDEQVTVTRRFFVRP